MGKQAWHYRVGGITRGVVIYKRCPTAEELVERR